MERELPRDSILYIVAILFQGALLAQCLAPLVLKMAGSSYTQYSWESAPRGYDWEQGPASDDDDDDPDEDPQKPSVETAREEFASLLIDLHLSVKFIGIAILLK